MGVGGGFTMAFTMERCVGPLDRLQLRGVVRHLSFNFLVVRGSYSWTHASACCALSVMVMLFVALHFLTSLGFRSALLRWFSHIVRVSFPIYGRWLYRIIALCRIIAVMSYGFIFYLSL